MGDVGVQRPTVEANIVLRDGATVHVRSITHDDEDAMHAFLESLSLRSRTYRFFSGAADLRGGARAAVEVDGIKAAGLVATSGPAQAIVGHATYVGEGGADAEVAFAIADEYQGRGVATVLLAQLAAVAERNGISAFRAVVLPENHLMVEVFRESGFPVDVRSSADGIVVTLPTALTEEGRQRFESRDRIAAIAAISSVLAPRSVALIGASRRRATVGGELLHNLIAGGFQGVVHPVNPAAEAVQAVRAYASVADVPGPVDLAVIAIPAEAVVDAARECGEAGVRSLVVISAGFAEAGSEGCSRQAELLDVCRAYGMRLVGPNCLGVLNTAKDVQMNATFMPRSALPGRIGFLSQSGGLGIAIVDAANRLGLGLSSFVSVGNKADLSGNDFVQYWEQDPDTDMVLLYLESFGNARKFGQIARRVGRVKPIAVVKSGRSNAGARATTSHTGALLQASDITADALFDQSGVIRTDTLSELFDLAALLASQPPPRGSRVAIVTNAGGPGILCADACAAAGLEVAELTPALRDELSEFLPSHAGLANPVDMVATATAEHYRRTIEAIGASGETDAVIVIFVPPMVTAADEVGASVTQAADALPEHLTVLSVFMAEGGPPAALRNARRPIPAYEFPEDAARALGHAARHGRWRTAPAGVIPKLPGVRADEAAAIIARALASAPGWLAPADVAELLDSYGIPLSAARQAADPAAAGAAAAQLGDRVALKAVAPGLLHKRDAGGVALDLAPADVERAAREMAAAVADAGFQVDGFLVQPMQAAGVELLVGMVLDQTFGPVVACGAGGTNVELLGDVAVRIAPLTDLDAGAQLRSLRTFPLLTGYRGAPPCDISAVQDLLLRVSALVTAHHEIAEMDLNPVVVRPVGAVAVDARIRVEACIPAPPAFSLTR